MTNAQRALTQTDLTDIEGIIFKYNDDFAVSLARSFERLEERIDATEARLYSRLAEIEDRVVAVERRLESLGDTLAG